MTARRRLVPLAQVRETLDFLRGQGVAVEKCAIDIGPDYVRVTPPANSNAGDSLGNYINRTPLRPQKAEKR